MTLEIERATFPGRTGLADFLELSILADPTVSFGHTRLGELLPALWVTDNAQLMLTISELARRKGLLGNRYPFEVRHGYVVAMNSGTLYEMFLTMAHNEVIASERREKLYPYITKRFEVLTEYSLSDFYGKGTQVVNFGWPSSIDRPKEFQHAIEWLSKKIGIDLGLAYRSPRRKDGGVDLVVWKSFGDSRTGVPIMLCQATIQREFLAKARDIDRRLWSGWLAMDVDPMVALCTPYVLENSELWYEIARNSLPLDRLRLVSMAPAPEFEVSANDLRYVESVISIFRNDDH